jgi:cell division protein ZapA
MARTVQVDIHGQRYALKSDLEPQYVNELAGFLDEKMRAAARDLANADPLGIAVVTALNLADELHRARQTADGQLTRVSAKAAEIERLIDAALDPQPVRLVVNDR